ncbi:hypothetical protein [Pelagibius sp. Alg239-R121]|uniref:hypothetical protein n=1 Tax=Pelagibius sp. Alg239-R121 TaxID=2993448 RepID=UPI0024A65AC9|nr:hypothetical protein [Pelagibius sp. Alg239-R121]
MLDEEELLHKMVEATEEAFTVCLERCGKENAIAFAISSDETAITFSPRVATQSGMEDFREFGTDEECCLTLITGTSK